jgi:hypothetical protein
MEYRNLRIAWSVAWGIFAVLLCVLWVRSYWWNEGCRIARGSVGSMYGHFAIGVNDIFFPPPFYSELIREDDIKQIERIIQENTTLGFGYVGVPQASNVIFPDRIAVLLFSAIAAVPWLRYFPRRFSLRTLIIATTLVAVVLGLIVALR